MSPIRFNRALGAALLSASCSIGALAQDAVKTTAADTGQTATSTPAALPAASPRELVLQRLANGAAKGADKEDRAAIASYYADPASQMLWVSGSTLTPRAAAVIAEIGRAADWGLTAASFDVLGAAEAFASPEAAADAEIRIGLATLKYASHARGGRIDVSLLGRNFDQKPPLLEPTTVLQGIAAAAAADAYLRGLHPKHPQFEKLRQALLAARKPAPAVEAAEPGSDVKLPAGPRIKPGQSHPQIALLRQRLNVPTIAGTEQLNDAQVQEALRGFQQEHGLDADGALTNATRTALNGGVKPAQRDNTQRILVNMERWRWLPEDLGAFHVWDNVPEYRMRVLKDSKVVHSETIIVGKPSTPTPVFSADMKYVIFHPTWGVPDGIKVNELAPSLRRSGSNSFFNWGESSEPAILRRHNLKVSYNGRPIDPSKVNWETADIRSFQFTQPASSSNVLGVVKFRFPNKHDVYMHDTPERALFSRAEKAFSHGCMRVQNPRRLAEVLLGEDKGWTPAQVGSAIAAGATQDVTLTKQIPVHVTYFTAVVEEDGQLKTFNDIYGHDSRIASALEGKAIKVIAQTDPAIRAEREVRRKVVKGPSQSSSGVGGLFSGLFGN